MKPPDIVDVLQKVLRVFRMLGIDYYIGGSLASSVYGVARSTLDADIVADIKPEHIFRIEKYLKNGFYVDVDMMKEALERRGSFNIIHTETMFKMDVFVLKDSVFDKESFAGRISKKVFDDPAVEFLFARPEDIILHKLRWYRQGKCVSERQWLDVLGVIKVQAKQLNTSYLDRWAEHLGVSDLLSKAISEAGIYEQ